MASRDGREAGTYAWCSGTGTAAGETQTRQRKRWEAAVRSSGGKQRWEAAVGSNAYVGEERPEPERDGQARCQAQTSLHEFRPSYNVAYNERDAQGSRGRRVEDGFVHF